MEILPNAYSIAAAAVVPGVLSQTRDLGFLRPYGLLGELVRVAGVGVVFVAVL